MSNKKSLLDINTKDFKSALEIRLSEHEKIDAIHSLTVSKNMIGYDLFLNIKLKVTHVNEYTVEYEFKYLLLPDNTWYKEAGTNNDVSSIIEELLNDYIAKYTNINESNINNPNHYQLENGKETIDIIFDTLGKKGFINYCKGNIIKYLTRYQNKNGVEDLKKAIKYLQFIIEREEE